MDDAIQVQQTTPLHVIYDRFLAKITDDMYMELTREDTERDLEEIFLSAVSLFEFPRFPIFNYNLNFEYMDEFGMVSSRGRYECLLTPEEIDIISDCMVIEWLRRQIASVENTRMKYSGSDFKFTSQANHLDKLLKFRQELHKNNMHKQRLYKRRKFDPNTGMITSDLRRLAGRE